MYESTTLFDFTSLTLHVVTTSDQHPLSPNKFCQYITNGKGYKNFKIAKIAYFVCLMLILIAPFKM